MRVEVKKLSCLSVLLFTSPVLLATQTTSVAIAQTSPIQIAQATSAKSVWKPFLSKEGRFQILMPGNPVATKQTQTSSFGDIDTQMFLVDRRQDAVAYMVAYSDLPNSLVQQISRGQTKLEQLFGGVRDGFVESIQGRIINERSINLAGYPGLEIQLELPRGRRARNRIILADERLYQVVVVVSKEKEPYLAKSLEGYLNSFRLVGR